MIFWLMLYLGSYENSAVAGSTTVTNGFMPKHVVPWNSKIHNLR